MKFTIEKNVFQKVENLCIGIVVAKGIKNESYNSIIVRQLQETVTDKRAKLKSRNVKEISDLNINANKFPSSIEALLDRISKGGEIPSINAVVDLVNIISLKHNVAIGAHDMDTFIDGLTVRHSSINDMYVTFGNKCEDRVVEEGELIYASGNQIRTRQEIWKDDIGRIKVNSKNILFLIDGFSEKRDSIVAARNELAEQLKKFFGCSVIKMGILDQKNRTFELDEMSEEDEIIENTIRVMLKGVAEHTDVYDIREKLKHVFLQKRPLRIKVGLDPSAPDIHIGHAVVLRKVRQLQDLGHKAIIIIGDFTGKIGDPTGKSKTRKQLSDEDVKANAKTYTEQVFKIIDKDKAEVRFNSEWLSKMNFENVINLSAKCTVARMMERDDFNNRFINHLPISVHEFFYPLMQAYDSVAIEADVEIGGTDQIFNVLMGRNIQRDYGQEPQIALFLPILEGIDGNEKMSKSLGNYIGVNEPAEVMYKKVMQIPDNCIIKYYTLCTDIHPSKIEEIVTKLNCGENPRDLKMDLAYEITSLYKGQIAANLAKQHFIEAYQKNVVPTNAPILNVSMYSNCGEALIEALIQLDRFQSKSEIRRLFKQNAITINDKKVLDSSDIEMLHNGDIVRIGKGNFYRIKLV